MEYAQIEKIFSEIFTESELFDIRHEIHMHPEIGGEEFHTNDVICENLEKWGIPYERGVADTGVVAKLSGKYPGKTIAIRADIDALPITEETDFPYKSVIPGRMHACGHDIHTTVLLGLAKFLKHLDGNYAGNFTLIFQPAEESFGGADRMIKAGVLENPHVDHVIGLHCGTGNALGHVGIRYGAMYAGSDAMAVKIIGKSAHAAYPAGGLDPIVMAGQMVSAVQSVVSRNISPQNSAVVTFGTIHGGTVQNQIPDEVELKGTIRTLDPETREFAIKRVEQVCRGVVEGMGGKLEFTRIPSYPPLVNDDAIVDVVREVLTDALGEERVHLEKQSAMGCEDFAYFAAQRPSAYWHLGCRPETGEVFGGHNCRFNPDEKGIDYGVKLQAAIALRLAGN